jgi:hypothetical protein
MIALCLLDRARSSKMHSILRFEYFDYFVYFEYASGKEKSHANIQQSARIEL